MIGLGRGRRRRRRETSGGQVIVIFAVSLVVLMGIAGLAFDIGRFYSEKRFLQNAADSGALAVANALIRGESAADAEAEGRDVLARNLAGSPSGTAAVVAATPQYDTGHAGQEAYMNSGILIDSVGNVRVAIKSSVGYTFGRAIGLGSTLVGGQARVATKGDLLPIAVRHYVSAPGPFAGAVAPCDPAANPNRFHDLVATSNTACLGSVTSGGRDTPNPGAPFNPLVPDDDPVNHGPIIALVGGGAESQNVSSFRGFVALDIRNFQYQSPPSTIFYNGVNAGMNANQIKDFEAAWIANGYPGPDFPPVTTPPDPNDQVGIIDGNTSGIVITDIDTRYNPGDEVLAAVYSGTVSTIPDFWYVVDSTVQINPGDNGDNTVSMTVQGNDAFTGVVDTFWFPDWDEDLVLNPYGMALSAPLAFTPSPMTPDGNVTWSTFRASTADDGIYTIWIQGHSSDPVLLDHYYPVGIMIGHVNRDFSTSPGAAVTIAATGGTGTAVATISTSSRGGESFNGTVNLSVEGGADLNGAFPPGIDPSNVSVTPTTMFLDNSSALRNQQATITVNGGTLAPGVYSLTLRVTGQNANLKPVTRLMPITVAIATATTSHQYVDILGFATFRITSIDSNTVYGYAISGTYADMNDPALRRGQVARLVPWN